ncbi:unannotated protein [freshwater metagenome]|uniref:Unannotated protein n=1 Tax=freshwater metagenome TaxID=449393 RepID=A0A6J6FBX0_9ZZZZ
MTHVNNQNPDDRNWMDIAREDAINEVRHNGQRLPFIAAAVSLLIIGGGAVFAQTNNEAPAQAEEISVTQSPTAITSSISSPTDGNPAMVAKAVPVIPNVSPKVNGYYEDDDDDEEEDDEEEDDEEEDDD